MTTPDNGAVIAGAFCTVSDLVMGDVTIGPSVNVPSYILRAANEITLKLSQKFKTPLTYQSSDPANAITTNFLRDVNSNIATGRIIMSLSVNRELERVNAYANRLLRDGTEAINSVLEGTIVLPGLIPATAAVVTEQNILVGNQDQFSGVDAFYNMTMPGGPGTVHRPWW